MRRGLLASATELRMAAPNWLEAAYGDCFAYAMAKQRGESLLFKGQDFSKTDIQSALEVEI